MALCPHGKHLPTLFHGNAIKQEAKAAHLSTVAQHGGQFALHAGGAYAADAAGICAADAAADGGIAAVLHGPALPVALSAAAGEAAAAYVAPDDHVNKAKWTGGAAGGAVAGGIGACVTAGSAAGPVGALAGAAIGTVGWGVGQAVGAGRTFYTDDRDDFGRGSTGLGYCEGCPVPLPVWNRGCKRCGKNFCQEDFHKHLKEKHPEDYCEICMGPC